MKTSAVPQGRARLDLVAIAALAALLSVSVLADSASAAQPIGKDGRIHSCYRIGGKGKGALRVVKGGHCRRGERRLAWTVVSPTAVTAAPGQQGAPGAPGAPGSAADAAPLEAKIASLTLKLEGLEGLLQGITRNDLLGAIGGIASLEALCGQATVLTDQTNLLRGALGGLSLNGVLTALGGLLNIPTLPVALPAFACP